MSTNQPDILTVAQAAAALGVGVRRVRQLIETGTLPASRFGRDWMIDRAVLESLTLPKRGWKKGRPRKQKTE